LFSLSKKSSFVLFYIALPIDEARKKFMQGPTIKKIFYFIFKTNIKFKDKIYF